MTTENTDAPQDGADLAAPGPDLAHLMAEAEGIEGAQEQAQAQQQQAQALATIQQNAAELEGALQMVRAMAAPAFAWWPQFGQVWNDQALRGIAEAGAAVMEKHGWTTGQAWAHLGPYIMLIGATLPPSLVTWQAMKAKREQERQAQQPRERAPMAPAPAEQAHPQQGERVT